MSWNTWVWSCKSFSDPGLAWKVALKKIKVKLDLLTDIDMLLVVQKGIRWWIYHSLYGYAKANNKCMKDYDKNKESPYLQYWEENNLHVWTIPQNFQ